MSIAALLLTTVAAVAPPPGDTPVLNDVGSFNIVRRGRSDANAVAPCTWMFEITNIAGFNSRSAPAGTSFDPDIHDLEVFWDIEGTPNSAFSAIDSGDLLTGWDSANEYKGKYAFIKFETSGTHTLNCMAVNPETGAVGYGSIEVTLQDADTFYSGTKTVCYSKDSDFTGAPSGAQQVSTLDAVNNAIGAASSPLRVLFRAGEDTSVDDDPDGRFFVNAAGRWLNHVGSFGAGAKPRLECDQQFGGDNYNRHRIAFSGSAHPNTFLTVEQIEFYGDWDAEKENGRQGMPPFNLVANGVDLHFVVDSCDFSGLVTNFIDNGGSTDGISCFVNCTATDWLDYGFYHGGNNSSRYCLLGCSAKQNVNAKSGNPTSDRIYRDRKLTNSHGPHRSERFRDGYVAKCRFLARGGWSSLPPDSAEQPCCRINQGSRAGARFIMSQCVAEGGAGVIDISRMNTSVTENPGTYLIEDSILIASAKTRQAFIWAAYGGFKGRNIYGIVPDVPPYHTSFPFEYAINYTTQSPSGNNLSVPQELENCTFYNARTGSNIAGVTWQSLQNPQGFESRFFNNVTHGPNTTPRAPVDETENLGINIYYKGILFNEEVVQGTVSGIGNGQSFTIPFRSGTNQAYWNARESAGSNRHRLAINSNNWHAHLGMIDVAVTSSGHRVTNRTGQTISGTYYWRADESDQYTTIPSTYATPDPQKVLLLDTGSSGLDVDGRVSYKDIEGTVRTTTPAAGAYERDAT